MISPSHKFMTLDLSKCKRRNDPSLYCLQHYFQDTLILLLSSFTHASIEYFTPRIGRGNLRFFAPFFEMLRFRFSAQFNQL